MLPIFINENYFIRKLESDETHIALSLVEKVFSEFEAPDYSDEGVTEFRRSVWNDEYLKQLVFYGAFDDQILAGTLATRNGGSHIALFFVDGEYQNQGIGKALFLSAVIYCTNKKITVNSSPFAVPIYHSLGFLDTDFEQEQNGIRYTPMVCDCHNVLIHILTHKDSVLACKYCNLLCKISLQNNCCYSYLELFASLLEHKNSLVRNRAISLLAINIRGDNDEKTETIINQILVHIADVKPITARQCIKALPDIAMRCPKYRKMIITVLNTSDFSRYADSMRPLLENDKRVALSIIEKNEYKE